MLETCAGSICCLTSTSNVLALIITIIMIIRIRNKNRRINNSYQLFTEVQVYKAIHLIFFISFHLVPFYIISFSITVGRTSIICTFRLSGLVFLVQSCFFHEYFNIRCDLVIVLYNFFSYYFLIVKWSFLFSCLFDA